MSDPNATDVTAPVEQDTPPENGGNWVESMVPEAYRDSGFVTKYGSPDEFFKGMDHLNKMAGQKTQGLVALGEDASDEDRAAFNAGMRSLNGIPETLEDYTGMLKADGFGEDSLLPKLTESMFNAGVPAPAVQGLIDMVAEEAEAAKAAKIEAYNAAFDKAEADLKEHYGVEDLTPYIERGEQVLDAVATPGAIESLKGSGATLDPEIIKTLNNIADALKLEGGKGPTGGGGGGGEPLTKAQLREMMQDPRYNDPDHRDDEYVQKIRDGFKALDVE